MHLGPELFKSLTGVRRTTFLIRRVGRAQYMIGGRLTFMLSGTPTVAPFIQAGAVRALASLRETDRMLRRSRRHRKPGCRNGRLFVHS